VHRHQLERVMTGAGLVLARLQRGVGEKTIQLRLDRFGGD